jgi:hypothetical protein
MLPDAQRRITEIREQTGFSDGRILEALLLNGLPDTSPLTLRRLFPDELNERGRPLMRLIIGQDVKQTVGPFSEPMAIHTRLGYHIYTLPAGSTCEVYGDTVTTNLRAAAAA